MEAEKAFLKARGLKNKKKFSKTYAKHLAKMKLKHINKINKLQSKSNRYTLEKILTNKLK